MIRHEERLPDLLPVEPASILGQMRPVPLELSDGFPEQQVLGAELERRRPHHHVVAVARPEELLEQRRRHARLVEQRLAFGGVLVQGDDDQLELDVGRGDADRDHVDDPGDRHRVVPGADGPEVQGQADQDDQVRHPVAQVDAPERPDDAQRIARRLPQVPDQWSNVGGKHDESHGQDRQVHGAGAPAVQHGRVERPLELVVVHDDDQQQRPLPDRVQRQEQELNSDAVQVRVRLEPRPPAALSAAGGRHPRRRGPVEHCLPSGASRVPLPMQVEQEEVVPDEDDDRVQGQAHEREVPGDDLPGGDPVRVHERDDVAGRERERAREEEAGRVGAPRRHASRRPAGRPEQDDGGDHHRPTGEPGPAHDRRHDVHRRPHRNRGLGAAARSSPPGGSMAGHVMCPRRRVPPRE